MWQLQKKSEKSRFIYTAGLEEIFAGVTDKPHESAEVTFSKRY